MKTEQNTNTEPNVDPTNIELVDVVEEHTSDESVDEPVQEPADPGVAEPVGTSESIRMATLTKIVNNQLTVNNAMAGEDWLIQAAKHGDIDYRMAILDELQEFWTSAWKFKWWDKTNANIDYRNSRMELVDILHFAVSEDLVLQFGPHTTLQKTVDWVSREAADSVLLALEDMTRDIPAGREARLKDAMMRFINQLTATGSVVSWKHFWLMVMLNDPEEDGAPEEAVSKVLFLYSAKAVLNQFRTRHRASPRGYKKVWIDGREDNDVMMSWLDTLPSPPTDQEINGWLEQMYSRVRSV